MRLFRRSSVKIWILVVLLFIYLLFIRFSSFKISGPGSLFGSRDYFVWATYPSNSREPQNFIIINSYMRSGSSFLGRLLGFRPDVFYIYEPLWKYGVWEFYKMDSTKCHMLSCRCRQTRQPGNVIEKLAAIGRCQGLRDVVDAKMTYIHSGFPWGKYKKCLKENPKVTNVTQYDEAITAKCIPEMQETCMNHNHVVTKVLRMDVAMYKDLLYQTDNSVIIHLFRDPRAIINSALKTNWYPDFSVVEHAHCLCKRMNGAYETGKRLMGLFPGRFRFVFYEDLLEDLNTKVNKLYRILNMTGIPVLGMDVFKVISRVGFLSDHYHRDNSTDFAEWWRGSMSWEAVQDVDMVCMDVYKRLGYQRFENEASLRDSQKRGSFKFPNDLKL